MGTQQMVVSTRKGRFLMAGVATITALVLSACGQDTLDGKASISPTSYQQEGASYSADGRFLATTAPGTPLPVAETWSDWTTGEPQNLSVLPIKGLDVQNLLKPNPAKAMFVAVEQLGAICWAGYSGTIVKGEPTIRVYSMETSSIVFFHGTTAEDANEFRNKQRIAADCN